jgi:hypothetical protein
MAKTGIIDPGAVLPGLQRMVAEVPDGLPAWDEFAAHMVIAVDGYVAKRMRDEGKTLREMGMTAVADALGLA